MKRALIAAALAALYLTGCAPCSKGEAYECQDTMRASYCRCVAD